MLLKNGSILANYMFKELGIIEYFQKVVLDDTKGVDIGHCLSLLLFMTLSGLCCLLFNAL